MAEGSSQPTLSAAGAAVRNPLSVIAMFVLLVEAIATITLIQVTEEKDVALPLVWFVVVFPTLIALLFFGTIWWKHQFLYSPYEYRSDESFLTAMQRLQRVELRQEAEDLNPQTADEEQSIAVVERLLEVDDVRAAVKVGRTFLKAKQSKTAIRIFQHILDKCNQTNSEKYAVFANLAYAQIDQGEYENALKNLETAMQLAGSARIAPWHQLAAAYAHNRLSQKDGDEDDLKSKELVQAAKSNSIGFNPDFFRSLYPEIADLL